MNSGLLGFSHIVGLLRGTNLKVLGKAGATAGAGLAGGTTSGAPTAGQFDVGEAVIGSDGTLFICTVAGSPGTWVQLGTLVDPLTTRGDLIVRGASSTGRLALGSNNQVLTSNGTDAVWAASPASAGGALTQISTQTLGSAAASITLSGLPGTYSMLEVVLQGRGDAVAGHVVTYVRCNNDTASNYDWSGFDGSTAADSQLRMGDIPAANGTANHTGTLRLWIYNYASTSFFKHLSAADTYISIPVSDVGAGVFSGTWRSTAALTRLDLFLNSGNFVANTVCTVYGYS